MKLIRKGEKHKRSYEATCTTCNSLFRARRDELKITNDRGEECIQTETCTECGSYGLRFEEVDIALIYKDKSIQEGYDLFKENIEKYSGIDDDTEIHKVRLRHLLELMRIPT